MWAKLFREGSGIRGHSPLVGSPPPAQVQTGNFNGKNRYTTFFVINNNNHHHDKLLLLEIMRAYILNSNAAVTISASETHDRTYLNKEICDGFAVEQLAAFRRVKLSCLIQERIFKCLK